MIKDINPTNLPQKISDKLAAMLGTSPAVVLCIGTDRATGDCLGPLVGQLLTAQFNINAFVYGTLETPVTALNLTAAIEFIQTRHPFSKVIAVDSCVGKKSGVGEIRIFKGSIEPGAASGKNLPHVGDVSITATTCHLPPASPAFSAVRLGMVYRLSVAIAAGISQFCGSAE